jgi:hypothetical protein
LAAFYRPSGRKGWGGPGGEGDWMINATINATVSNIASSGQLDAQTLWMALGSVATLLAVVVALFRNEIRAWFSKPELEFVKNITDPQEVTAINPVGSSPWSSTPQKWWHVIIVNKGKCAAKNVRLYFTGLESNSVNGFNRFISIPMSTSWANLKSVGDLPPNLNRAWDLGYLTRQGPWSFYLNGGKTPNDLRNISETDTLKPPFKFTIQLVICADNAKTQMTNIELEVDPNNYTDGVKIKFVGNV